MNNLNLINLSKKEMIETEGGFLLGILGILVGMILYAIADSVTIT